MSRGNFTASSSGVSGRSLIGARTYAVMSAMSPDRPKCTSVTCEPDRQGCCHNPQQLEEEQEGWPTPTRPITRHREEQDKRQLSRHEQLPQMGAGILIRLPRHTGNDVRDHDHKCRCRAGERYPSTDP